MEEVEDEAWDGWMCEVLMGFAAECGRTGLRVVLFAQGLVVVVVVVAVVVYSVCVGALAFRSATTLQPRCPGRYRIGEQDSKHLLCASVVGLVDSPLELQCLAVSSVYSTRI